MAIIDNRRTIYGQDWKGFPYGKTSLHDTQAQIFAVLVLRQFFNTDYRGIVELLQEHRQIKNALGLTKIPHFTTLQKAQQRMLKKTSFRDCWAGFSKKPKPAD